LEVHVTLTEVRAPASNYLGVPSGTVIGTTAADAPLDEAE